MAYTQKQYAESDAVKKFRENMEDHAPYESKWQPQINDAVNQYLKRDQFKYDVNEDALYQQMKDMYVIDKKRFKQALYENDINYMLGELQNGNNKISCQVKGETEGA